MYIYAPHLDAYMCFHRSSHSVSFRKMDTILTCDVFGWEDWDEEDDDDRGKRIFYLCPRGNKYYLSWLPGTKNLVLYNYKIFLYVCLPTPTTMLCCIDREHLVLRHRFCYSVAAPTVAEIPMITLDEGNWTEEEKISSRVEMFSMLPHSLK